MDLRYLRFFIAVAEELNFTRAAERLHTVQPSVSRQIRRLEEIVGTPLFHRKRHQLTLTVAGKVFLKESRAVLEQMNRAISLTRQSARADAGKVAIGFILGTEIQLFPRLVPALRERYPDIQLSYQALTEAEQITALEEGTINAAFTAGPIYHPAILSEFVMHQTLVVVLPTTHPLARKKTIPVERLAEWPMNYPSAGTAPNYEAMVDQIAELAGVEFKKRFEHDNVLSALNTVSMGMGLCLIPDYQRYILANHLTTRPLDLDPQPALDLVVAYMKDDKLPALALFLSVVRDCMRNPFPMNQPAAHAAPGRAQPAIDLVCA